MDVSLLGAAREVGRSGVLVSVDEMNLLFDYGVKLDTPPSFPLTPSKVDALFLSHAHLDHCGMVPWAFRALGCHIFSLNVSYQMGRLLQEDFVKINKLKKMETPYGEDEIKAQDRGFQGVNYGEEHHFGNVRFSFHDAGHIPGSASVLVTTKSGHSILYSGDVQTADSRLLKGCSLPHADTLILESTYGDRNHPDRSETVNRLMGSIKETLDGGGIAMMPAFAVGRTQELLLLLKDSGFPVYLEGMGQEVTRIILQYPELLKNAGELEAAANGVSWIADPRGREEVLHEPCVILTTAGMLTGGPIMWYLERLGERRNHSILLTGYQVAGTNGRMLLDEGCIIGDSGQRVPIRCKVESFDLSAHTDQDGLRSIVDKVNPSRVILNHGDPEAVETLSGLLPSGIEVLAPSLGEILKLD
ncbi:Ribonuclease J [uncultured archaeon]|nr:Ribonuclease J [uncultured archaeon]